jgi:SAM-dependent methyltransferase
MTLVRWLYAFTIFLSAFLLFVVEPMAAKQMLPLFGGSSAVWISCLVFFQTVLLLGYLYAHWLSGRPPVQQARVHVVLLAIALLMLGVHARPSTAAVSYHPALVVFWVLSIVIGIPYLALSATTPLATAWYARTFPGESPYRLFALSSFASMLALCSYPALIEPRLTMRWQTTLWMAAFFLFAILCGAIAWSTRTQPAGTSLFEEDYARPGRTAAARPASPLLWFLLAMGGGMMLTAVTSHLTQNIAAIPLLWLPPLALYLLTFILTFQGGGWYPRSAALRLALLALVGMGYMLLDIRKIFPIEFSVPLFLTGLFLICFFLHGELYARRPQPQRLTHFYLCVSAGAAAGSVLVGVIAPLVLHANYDLACTLVVVAAISAAATWQEGWGARLIWTAGAVGAIFVVHAQIRGYSDDTVALARSFYGTLRVRQSFLPPQSETNRQLLNGTIDHGAEWFAPAFVDQPITYYAPNSGIGLALRLCCGTRPKRVGVIGLGTGTIAAYGKSGDLIRFYEINPMVESLAKLWFTYLRDSKARIEIVMGDARLSLEAEPPQHFDVIAVDAFSGDAIPVHLLTRQALALYRRHLQPDGVIAFHVSNRFIDLEPVVAGIARDAGLQAVAVDTSADDQNGYYSTDWVLVTANRAFLEQPEVANDALPVRKMPGLRTWTDSYSSVFPLLKWHTR